MDHSETKLLLNHMTQHTKHPPVPGIISINLISKESNDSVHSKVETTKT